MSHTTRKPLFYWNGIKDYKGAELQPCVYRMHLYMSRYQKGTICIDARHYRRFSKLVRESFVVENDTDAMTDYFENDSIYVEPTHPMYSAVLTAYKAQEAHDAAMLAKRMDRFKGAALAA